MVVGSVAVVLVTTATRSQVAAAGRAAYGGRMASTAFFSAARACAARGGDASCTALHAPALRRNPRPTGPTPP